MIKFCSKYKKAVDILVEIERLKNQENLDPHKKINNSPQISFLYLRLCEIDLKRKERFRFVLLSVNLGFMHY